MGLLQSNVMKTLTMYSREIIKSNTEKKIIGGRWKGGGREVEGRWKGGGRIGGKNLGWHDLENWEYSWSQNNQGNIIFVS